MLAAAKARDQVVIRLESPGEVVHGYGLAASLQRLRDKQIPLTVAVDKVAASGGYMMACVANKIVSAPFAILGSIGVVAQIPNLHRFLKNKDIDIELHTAGQYKRTLTMLGENTEEGRRKFREDLNETHHLFKDFVQRMRPGLDIEQVATGEHWYGVQALEKGLVDAVETSDELLLGLMESHEVIGVRYQQRKKMLDRFTGSAAESADRLLLLRWQQRGIAADIDDKTRLCLAFVLIRAVLISAGLNRRVIFVRTAHGRGTKHIKYAALRRRQTCSSDKTHR